MKGILVAALAVVALTALLLALVLDETTLSDPAQLRITIVFFTLVAGALVIGGYAGYYGRKVYRALMEKATTVTVAAERLAGMADQTAELINANRLLSERYRAAVADAERTRVRFLEEAALSRPPSDPSSDPQRTDG